MSRRTEWRARSGKQRPGVTAKQRRRGANRESEKWHGRLAHVSGYYDRVAAPVTARGLKGVPPSKQRDAFQQMAIRTWERGRIAEGDRPLFPSVVGPPLASGPL